MSSVLRGVGRSKKKRRLGKVQMMSREDYAEGKLDTKVEMIRSLVPLGLMHVQELLDEEVTALTGERYARKEESNELRRHGSNPGTVGLAGQRVPIRVPRVRSAHGSEIPLRSYQALSVDNEVNELLLKRVLYGISCRNYEGAAEAIPGAIGISSSTVSRQFVRASAAKLREFQERDLSREKVVALFLDGKVFADTTMVVAMGITAQGDKRFLGFVETDTENEKVLTPFLRSLMERGMDISSGILVIIDGAKGLRAAVRVAFKKKAAVQRCQWHKRENVAELSSPGDEQDTVCANDSSMLTTGRTYDESLSQNSTQIHRRAGKSAINPQLPAWRKVMGETLTLHRLGVVRECWAASFKTTDCLESVNALVEERCAKVDHWKNSSQRQRWLASALIDIEPRLRKVKGYRHLPKLPKALETELGLEASSSAEQTKQAA